MTRKDHIALIEKAITTKGGVWADLGSGEGAFTLALRDIAGKTTKIYSVDKDQHRLDVQKQNFTRQFPKTTILFIQSDFTQELALPSLDGIIMANSLHFYRNKHQILKKVRGYLKPKGILLIVEYNVDTGNYWVPYPFSFPLFKKLAQEAGYDNPKLLATIPSAFLREIYSAVAVKR